jgi:hypothetical protein
MGTNCFAAFAAGRWAGLAAGLCLLLAACNTAKVTKQADIGPVPSMRPAVIYVADFDLDAGEIQSQGLSQGIMSSMTARPVFSILPHPLGVLPQDKTSTAHELVEVMATSLVTDLTKAGFPAQRISADASPPSDGWLLRGVFTQVDEGNRLRRAIIGVGAGKTQMQVVTKLDDLSQGPPQPFYEVDTSAESGKMPGAIVTMSPAAAAVKFVLASGDLNRNARDTASKIATSVAARVPK